MATRNGTAGYKERQAFRRMQVFDMRLKGYTYRRIAEELKCSVFTAYKDVATVLAEVNAKCMEKAEAMRAIELDRLDDMLAGLWPAATKGDEKAVGAALKIAERRAKLTGIDAPTKTQLSGADGKPLRTYVDMIREIPPDDAT